MLICRGKSEEAKPLQDVCLLPSGERGTKVVTFIDYEMLDTGWWFWHQALSLEYQPGKSLT